MQKLLRIPIAAIVVLAIVAFMTTYTVRFTESAVVTTFGKASEASVKTQAGLGFKWPYPIQSVTKYDTRARYVETRGETVSTADNRQIVVKTYLVWQVSDPLKFFQSYGAAGSRESDHVRQAEDALRAKLRAALAEASKFRLSDILTTDSTGSKLPQLEAAILTQLKGSGSGALSDTGVSPQIVGIHSIELPDSVTEAVYQSMEAGRKRLADAEVQRGSSQAETIRTKGEQDARTIMSFAERRASVIRGQGEQEAARYLAQQKQDEQLAVFLQEMRFLNEALSNKRTTLTLPASLPGIRYLDPTVGEKLRQGNIPSQTGGTSSTQQGGSK
jgi:modulator of FtsH protease HflC